MKKMIILIAWCCFFGVASAAFLEEDFEAYSLGETLDGKNGWVEVNATDRQGGRVSSGGSLFGQGAQALHITDTDASDGVPDYMIRNTFETQTGDLRVTFDVRMQEQRMNEMFLLKSAGQEGVKISFAHVGDNYRLRYQDAADWNTIDGFRLSLNTWYRFEIIVSEITGAGDTFDLKVFEYGKEDPVVNSQGLGLRSNVSGLDTIEFRTLIGLPSQGADFHIDNITISDDRSLVLYVVE